MTDLFYVQDIKSGKCVYFNKFSYEGIIKGFDECISLNLPTNNIFSKFSPKFIDGAMETIEHEDFNNKVQNKEDFQFMHVDFAYNSKESNLDVISYDLIYDGYISRLKIQANPSKTKDQIDRDKIEILCDMMLTIENSKLELFQFNRQYIDAMNSKLYEEANKIRRSLKNITLAA
ncbi:hypothetical protein GSH19_00345 [Lactobacillus sp. S2-2]|uniref:hypothetical protein n=1 Tax=Lactobacillus sp. S2-2 TaxID=2692917 RepID=UPI001F1DCA56|nr:hypothetical protein [Lactobacillus sp. S2-2]MCF6514635.1 hypothetical protein [Lactobacillus sp. S2-2]